MTKKESLIRLDSSAPKDVMESLSPLGRPSTVKDVTDAVMYLADAATVTDTVARTLIFS